MYLDRGGAAKRSKVEHSGHVAWFGIAGVDAQQAECGGCMVGDGDR